MSQKTKQKYQVLGTEGNGLRKLKNFIINELLTDAEIIEQCLRKYDYKHGCVINMTVILW